MTTSPPPTDLDRLASAWAFLRALANSTLPAWAARARNAAAAIRSIRL